MRNGYDYENSGKFALSTSPRKKIFKRCAGNINIPAYIVYIPMYCILGTKSRPKLRVESRPLDKLTSKETRESRDSGSDWYRILDMTTVLEETRVTKIFEPYDPVNGFPLTVSVIARDV